MPWAKRLLHSFVQSFLYDGFFTSKFLHLNDHSNDTQVSSRTSNLGAVKGQMSPRGLVTGKFLSYVQICSF